ncbi:MAG: amidase family protein [Polyangiaceae bacterium]|jgi:amidase|nr:amidase family protein [Polyangiaceae bacterium]
MSDTSKGNGAVGGARDPFWGLDAVAQASLVRAREVSALELVDAAIARIERLDPVVHAIEARGFDQAREQARGALPAGPLSGVPFLVKDLLPYPGLPCSFGSRMLRGQPAPPEPDYATALREAGLVVLGKTTTSEFGLLGTTEPLGGEPTRNPWDLGRSAAGSSGGSAAAVASGMVPMAHASDGGGSIRIPASVCGLFGFKPSRGRNRSAGMGDGRSATDMIIEHAVSRSVRDSAVLLEATQRTDAGAPFAPLRAGQIERRRGLRMALVERTVFGREAAPEVREALEATAALCRQLGHEVIPTAGPAVDGPAISAGFFRLCGAGLGAMLGPMLQAMGEGAAGVVEPFTLELIRRAMAAGPEPLEAIFEATGRAVLEFMAGYDVVLCPTIPMPPFELGRLRPDQPADEIIAFTEYLAGYTSVYSVAGAPAMSVPLHQTSAGLPVGSQFIAAPGAEALLFGLAYDIEEAAPWAQRRPLR